jgi:sarcosine oxidase
MNPAYDAIVLGLGAMGSATLYHLARRGARVLGIDQFAPPHHQGSSHGETRVIREAYFEHPSYVPLIQRAYVLWAELEADAREKLYLKTGGLMIGRPDSIVVTGAIRSAREHQLPHEILGTPEMLRRFPGLRPEVGMNGVLEPRAGILFPERCIAAHLRLAKSAGAEVRMNEPARSWTAQADAARVHTSAGEYSARKLVITAGAWLPRIAPRLAPKLQVERQVLLWFKTRNPAIFSPDRFPIHLWEYEPDLMFYGFPDLGDGLKLAFHHQGEITNADLVDRTIRDDDVARMRGLMTRFLPQAADAPLLRGTVCLYTNTPDGHFILDRHPDHVNVILGSPCSGHGFKFASAIGEVLADFAQDRAPNLDLRLFSLQRFA